MSRMNGWPSGLLDTHALSWLAFLIAIPVSLIGVLTVIPVGIPASTGIPLWLIASAVSTLAMSLVMSIGSQLCRRISKPVTIRVTVLVSVLIAGAVRGLAIGLVFQVSDVADRASLGMRTLSSGLIFGLWLILIGALIASSVRYRESRSALLDELLTRELQERLLDEDRTRLQRDAAVQQFAETTAAVRGILDEAEATDDADYARISRSIQEAVDERVRPLVHQMWQSPDPAVDDRGSTRDFIRRAYLSRVPAAWAIVLYGVIATGASLLSGGGASPIALDWQTALIAASAETAAVAAVILIERVVRPRATLVSRTIAMVALLVLPLLAAWLLTSERISGEIATPALFSLVITAPVIVFASCATSVALSDRLLDTAELQRRLDRDEWSEQLRLLEQREAESDVASEIHNTLQARLVAAAMQLQTAALEGDDARAALALRDARAALDSAELDPEIPSAPTSERLASIVEAWRGITEVRIDCAPDVEQCASARLAVDAVEECVANASRHAGAAHVAVRFHMEGSDLVVIVEDDGRPMESDAALGLGTVWMQRVSGDRLSRSRLDGCNRIELRIAA